MIKYDFAGKVALVTGSSRGIGAAVLSAFARAGATCVLHFWDDPDGANRKDAEALAGQLGGVVTVNAVAPGVVQTPMHGEIKPEVMAEYLKQIPVGRLGKPEDIANAILFLASDETGYITGQVLPVTGGWLV